MFLSVFLTLVAFWFCLVCDLMFGYLLLSDLVIFQFGSFWGLLSVHILFQGSIFKLVAVYLFNFIASLFFQVKHGHACGHVFCRSCRNFVFGSKHGYALASVSDRACIAWPGCPL